MSKWLDKYKQKINGQSTDTMSTLSVPTLNISTNKMDSKISKTPIPHTDKTDIVETPSTMSTLSVSILENFKNNPESEILKIPRLSTDKTDIVKTSSTMSTLSVSTLGISTKNNNSKILPNPNPNTDSVDTVKASQTSSCRTQKITKKALHNFLGEDWQDYADNPEALKIWADMLSKKEVMISLKVLTKEQYENLFN